MGAADMAIIVLVVDVRLLLPLAVPDFPLIGVVSRPILDAGGQGG